jgi:hypothetical protein
MKVNGMRLHARPWHVIDSQQLSRAIDDSAGTRWRSIPLSLSGQQVNSVTLAA